MIGQKKFLVNLCYLKENWLFRLPQITQKLHEALAIACWQDQHPTSQHSLKLEGQDLVD